MKRGQTTLEYILLIGAMAAGIIAMIVYVSRGHQGNLRSQAEQLGAGQYAPGKTNINNSENKRLISTASSGSATTVQHGNLNEPNEVLNKRLGEIIGQWKKIYGFRQDWENLVETEATGGAAEVRRGVWGWASPAGGLAQIETALNTANDGLKASSQAADAARKGWLKKRTPDKTTTKSSSSEKGALTTNKKTDETLGAW